MWATLIFCGTTALFLSMTLAALWHFALAQRLPPLEVLNTRDGVLPLHHLRTYSMLGGHRGSG